MTFDNQVIASLVSHFDLVDVPELGYRRTDRPYPRGALRVKSRRMIPGYYKNAEATAALFDAEGWLCMGDIVEQRGPTELHYIDRKNSVLKLAHGEYVPITRLEGVYGSLCPSVAQMYLYGNSERTYLLAVVVPTAQALAKHGDALARQLATEMRHAAAQQGLRGHEVPRAYIIEPASFTVSNGLLTESNKPARARLKATYGARLEALYTQTEAAQQADLRTLHQAPLPVEEKARRILAGVLGLPELEEEHLQSSLAQLGGDSLHAARFCSLLQELGRCAPASVTRFRSRPLDSRPIADARSGGQPGGRLGLAQRAGPGCAASHRSAGATCPPGGAAAGSCLGHGAGALRAAHRCQRLSRGAFSCWSSCSSCPTPTAR